MAFDFLRHSQISVLVAVAILQECCMASVDKQWLVCSGERIVAYGPLVYKRDHFCNSLFDFLHISLLLKRAKKGLLKKGKDLLPLGADSSFLSRPLFRRVQKLFCQSCLTWIWMNSP